MRYLQCAQSIFIFLKVPDTVLHGFYSKYYWELRKVSVFFISTEIASRHNHAHDNHPRRIFLGGLGMLFHLHKSLSHL